MNEIDRLEFKASRLKTQIRTDKRADHFFDAEKHEAELCEVNQEIEKLKK